MNPLYLDSLVTAVLVDNHELVIKDLTTKIKLHRFKPREIPYDAIIVQRTRGSISFSAIDWLVKNSVSITILDWLGNILGQFLPQEPISNKLKLAQYEAYTQRETHLKIARTIIKTKLERQKEFLSSLSKNYPIDVPKIPLVSPRSEDFMRNQEARYASDYFSQYSIVCKELGQNFKGRTTKNNKNANDLVNACLNYGYSVLQTYVRRAINSIGMDNSLPFVHDLGHSTGLVFDLMELWRTNIDYSVLETLERLHSIHYNVFRMNDDYVAMLSRDTAKLLFERVKLNLSLQEIILNCRVLARFMLGIQKTLSFALNPIQLREKFETQEVKQAILTKNYRELDMNKSTLWYQRERLKNTGSVKLYGKTKQYFAQA